MEEPKWGEKICWQMNEESKDNQGSDDICLYTKNNYHLSGKKKKINKNCQVEEGRRKSNRKKVKLAVPKSAGPNARRPGALKELAEIDMKFFDFLSKWLLGMPLESWEDREE